MRQAAYNRPARSPGEEEMRARAMTTKALLYLTVILAGIVCLHPEGRGAEQSPFDSKALDAVKEFVRGINSLSSTKRTLPQGNAFVESVRTKYGIPERVPILAPHGGTEIALFIYNSEEMPLFLEGDHITMTRNEYKHLQSLHNLESVYCLFEREPIDLGDVILAFDKGKDGKINAFYNLRGTLGEIPMEEEHATYFRKTRHIVRPCALGAL